MKNIIYALFLTLPIFLISCKGKERIRNEQSDFSFQVPELDLNVITSKRIGGEFYVMFLKQNTVTHALDSIDYFKFRTANMSDISIVFDPNNEKNIYTRESFYLEKTNPIYYQLQVINDSEFDSLFFEPRITTQPLILKSPFVFVGMITSTYTIYMKKYDFYKKIKEGDIYGGW